MSDSPGTDMASSYWCHRCTRFVRIVQRGEVVCPDCDGGFLEEIERSPRLNRRYMTGAEVSLGTLHDLRILRGRRAGNRSSFNPVIVLRGPSGGRGGGGDADRSMSSGFFFYFDDGTGSGLRPLPATMSEVLMEMGFDRLLDRLAQIDVNGLAGSGFDHLPASKAAVDSMPTVEITAGHVGTDSHCAVCKEAFELGSQAREMPCKHIYHQDCILPWLSLRNSCPVCRHVMPTDEQRRGASDPDGNEGDTAAAGRGDETIGLTIWRLPGGGFAVGRLSGGWRAGEQRELPVVYTEIDGGLNSGGAPRRISWASGRSNSRQSRGIGQIFRNLFSLIRRRGSSSSSRLSSDFESSSSPTITEAESGIRGC
ncbi:E3 ubiquitin-protein ligase RING1 [Apostasia shenzhenica]|uniref:RING-type E3 ubiquitin transferase n=1 Tax=Apostasia shenzhenica TaxID=1088818 RepID=A0A2I0AA98_9ASPA|nr:E3 ubiquitin-protein ligase RING1 [Apostasia shenzhenica]